MASRDAYEIPPCHGGVPPRWKQPSYLRVEIAKALGHIGQDAAGDIVSAFGPVLMDPKTTGELQQAIIGEGLEEETPCRASGLS